MHVFEIFYKLLISNVDKSNRTMSNTSETNEHALTLTPSQMLKRYGNRHVEIVFFNLFPYFLKICFTIDMSRKQ